MTIHILTTNKNGKIEIDPKELTDMLNQAYQEGKNSTKNPYIIYTTTGPYLYTTAKGIEYNPNYYSTTCCNDTNTTDHLTINCSNDNLTAYNGVDIKTNYSTTCDR